MSQTALLFAGQGARTVGMGKDLAEKFAQARPLVERANALLGFLKRIDKTAQTLNVADAASLESTVTALAT